MFECQKICRRAGTDDLDDGARAAKNCTLPAFDPRRWRGRPDEELVQLHMGLPPRYDLDGKARDFMAPAEDVEGEGCPGGWYRCAFMASLHRYRRRGTEQRVENLLLTRCQDRLVLEAIDYLEHEEGHALGAFYEARDADG